MRVSREISLGSSLHRASTDALILENTVFDRYLRYAFAVYPVIIWALSAVVANNWDTDNPTGPNIFSLVLLVLTIVLALLRIVLFIIFTIFRPLRPKLPTM